MEELCNFHHSFKYELERKSHYEHISNFLCKATGSNINACKHYVKLKLMELTYDFYPEDWSDETPPTIEDAPPEIIIKKFMMNLEVGKEMWSINIGYDWTHF